MLCFCRLLEWNIRESKDAKVITRALFQRADIHKATLDLANGRVKNQIDQWGANANSDHYLVRTKIRLKRKYVSMKKFKARFNTDKLKAETQDGRTQGSVEKARGAQSREEREEIEKLWEAHRKAYMEYAEVLLGFRKRHEQTLGQTANVKGDI